MPFQTKLKTRLAVLFVSVVFVSPATLSQTRSEVSKPSQKETVFIIERTNTELVKVGTLVGTVRDPLGAVIAGAEIVLLDRRTNHERVTKADDRGSFSLAGLIGGQYQVTIAAKGFKLLIVSEIELKSDEAYRTEIFLDPGRPTEENMVPELPIEPTFGMMIIDPYIIKKRPNRD